MRNADEFLFTEKYRPHRIADTVLPKNLKETFQKFVDDKNIPNMILSGGPGTGKTTAARAMLDELNCDYIIINGSLRGNIDTLRVEIQQFASSVSLQGGRKYVILDEADYLNPNSTQPALRNFMEEYSRNCGFILTCNFKNRIIEPLHSRCSVIDFTIPINEKPTLAKEFFIRVKNILSLENIEYEPKAIIEIITKYFPDNRRILNELQRYSATGKIDSGILSNLHDITLLSLVKTLKEKNYAEMRKWVSHNIDNDVNTIFRTIYDHAHEHLKPESIPALVVALGEYQYKAAFVADQEINLAACLTEIMYNCQFL
jgi:DNA polymerase III delta prime subunit